MAYRIEITPAAQRDLKKLRGPIRKRIRDAIDGLAEDPRPPGIRKLVDEDDLWRVRVGDFRIIYTIEDNRLLVLVVRVANRRDAFGK